MADVLRDTQPLRALAETRQIVDFQEEIGSFERLSDSIERDLAALGDARMPKDWRKSAVRGRLAFAPATAGQATATGRLTARVPAVCQRCLEPFEWPLESRVDVRFTTAHGSHREDERELWELDDERVRPLDVVDELLVMALPLSARHSDDARCVVTGESRPDGDTTRPFADLKARMDEAGRN
ncbi:MAG TPA: DUF177 domain-containing protein [Woeseiaceae bacterium]|nr:DUF177 domain-containing protein [Woeseiaceae bacterium]